MDKLGQLVPLVVPWSVAPSTPYLQLCADEECKAFVTFIGFFAFYEGDNQIDPKDIGPDGRLLPSAGTTNVDPHKTDGRYQQVRVDFTSVYCACLSAPMSSKKIFDTDLYELSPVLGQGQKQSSKDYLDWYNGLWHSTRECPDPSAYEVIESSWLKEKRFAGARGGLCHYVIVGEDAYVEVAARGWSWKSEGTIVGPW